jgi:hypothetical protein
MVYLKIVAAIPSKKMIEFSQTKMAFLQDLQGLEGYGGFTEKHSLLDYQLMIEWKDKNCLKQFQESDIYNFFHGAIVTLGSIKSITILSKKEALA